MHDMNSNKCSICERNVLTHSRKLKCCLCMRLCYVQCLPVFTNDDCFYADNPLHHWSCPKCNETLFPFNTLEDNDFINITNNWPIILMTMKIDLLIRLTLNKLILKILYLTLIRIRIFIMWWILMHYRTVTIIQAILFRNT